MCPFGVQGLASRSRLVNTGNFPYIARDGPIYSIEHARGHRHVAHFLTQWTPIQRTGGRCGMRGAGGLGPRIFTHTGLGAYKDTHCRLRCVRTPSGRVWWPNSRKPSLPEPEIGFLWIAERQADIQVVPVATGPSRSLPLTLLDCPCGKPERPARCPTQLCALCTSAVRMRRGGNIGYNYLRGCANVPRRSAHRMRKPPAR